MAVDYSKFDKAIDVEGLKKDVADAARNEGNFVDVPHGIYEISIDKMELVESKKGDPMVSIWFKILEGEYKNQRIFMNQVITKGFQIHIVNELLKSLGTDKKVEFETFSQYGQLLLDVHEDIDDKFEYALDYYDNKGYDAFEIKEIFELEN